MYNIHNTCTFPVRDTKWMWRFREPKNSENEVPFKCYQVMFILNIMINVIFFYLEKSLISCKFKNDFFNICKIACLNL